MAADRVGVRELRQNLSRYLRRVERGERLEVTERGKTVAVLGPVDESGSALRQLVASGRARPPEGDLLDLAPPKGPLTTKGTDAPAGAPRRPHLTHGREAPVPRLLRYREARRPRSGDEGASRAPQVVARAGVEPGGSHRGGAGGETDRRRRGPEGRGPSFRGSPSSTSTRMWCRGRPHWGRPSSGPSTPSISRRRSPSAGTSGRCARTTFVSATRQPRRPSRCSHRPERGIWSGFAVHRGLDSSRIVIDERATSPGCGDARAIDTASCVSQVRLPLENVHTKHATTGDRVVQSGPKAAESSGSPTRS